MKKLVLILLLSGCGYTVPSTIADMTEHSPLDADPAAIEIALDLPPGMAVPEGGARMTLDVTRPDQSGKVSETYVLQVRPGPAAGVQVEPGHSVVVYRLKDADIARLREIQVQAAGWNTQASPDKGSANIGLGVDACKTGDGPDADARSSAYIRLAEDGVFLPLIRPVMLRSYLGQAAFDAIAPCDGPS